MANDIIKPHKFEIAKNAIHSLSQNVPNVYFQKFQTEGLRFSWNNHNITGKEVNENLVSPLQSALIAQNSTIKSLFNIADEVYKALESLDKEYIQGIIAAVKSAEIASEQAKTASTKANTASTQALDASRRALDASARATNTQSDIKRTIEALQATVNALKAFKEQVDAFVEKVNQATTRIDGDIESLKQYRTILESYQHLGDVDTIWSDIEANKTNLSGLNEILNIFMKKTHSEQERIEGLIHQMEVDNNLVRLQYNKKIKIAYWVGGSAVGLTIANFLLQIVGVL